MKALVAFLLLLPVCTLAADSFQDKTEKELLTAKGTPKTKASLGPKTIYTWDDARATVMGGTVIEYRVTPVAVEPPKAKVQPAKQPLKQSLSPAPASPQLSAAEQKLREAQQHMNIVSGLKGQRELIAMIQHKLDMYDHQSAFNRNGGYVISTEEHEVDKARLEVEKARLAKMESEAGY